MATEHYAKKAVWPESKKAKKFGLLPGDIEVDVAIVGGGITGISTAYYLSRAGKKVAVLEAFQVGKGTTGSSTGNLYATVDEQLYTISSKHDETVLKEVVNSRLTAINFIEHRIQEFEIDCNFQRVPFYLFTTPQTMMMSSKITKEQDAAKRSGLNVSTETPQGFPFTTDKILTVQHQGQFNPLAYIQEFACSIEGENCNIYEDTQVTRVKDGEPCVVETSRGVVKAHQVVMATHTPKGIYAVHTAMEPYREHAMAVQILGELPPSGIYWHMKASQHYSLRPFRSGSHNYLLVLGESYKVGHKNDTQQSFKKIEEYVRTHFDVKTIDYTWAAQNYKAADSLPFIGRSPLEKNIFIATGFAADGLVYGTLASMIISDTILGIENQWAKIYSPTRFTPLASAPKFMKENIDVGVQLLKDYLFYGEASELKEIKPGEGKTITLNNEKLAAYRDEQGQLHLVSSICPHMGCIVHWNNGERSWDCPCHGSRFSFDGEVLEGPAFTGLAKPNNANK